jgi:iron(III) transport system permease protein
MYVYVYLFVAAGLERLDPSLDEAAAGLGARRARRFGRVTLPLLAPALAGSMLLVFMSSLGSYSAPYVFGGGLRVLSTQIVASRLNGDEGIAYVETTVLAVSAIAAVLLLRRLEGRGPRASSLGKGVRAERRPVARGGARWLVAGLAAVAVLFLVLPHLALVLVAFAKDGAWTTELLPPVYTLDNWRRVTSDPELVRPVRNSVAMALAATGGNVLVCGLAAYLVVLRRFRGRRLLALLLSLPVGGAGHGGGRGARVDLRPAPAPGVPLGARRHLGDPAARLLHPRRAARGERGRGVAAADGPGDRGGRARARRELGRAVWRVVLPAARPGLVAGATLAMITGVGEFVASVILYTHRNRPISVEILAELRALSFGGAAAYSVLLIGIVLVITLAARLLGEERRTPAERKITIAG